MIPDWLRDKLASPPGAGAGIHAWLFSCARQLHAHMPPEAVAAALGAATAEAGRPVPPREIRDAVNNSRSVAWSPAARDRAVSGGGSGRIEHRRGTAVEGGPGAAEGPLRRATAPVASAGGAPALQFHTGASDAPPQRWPRANALARRGRLRDAAVDGVCSAADLWERSPVRPGDAMTADDWLDWLFPGADWLCLAVDHPATARSRRREKWSFGPADACSLVVPSPMTGPSGRGLDGRASHRCLDNTGPRRWLVIEFDQWEGAPMDLDEQAALHWSLGNAGLVRSLDWPRLALCVHSGGKSLHGWYGPVADEERAHDLMAYAVSLGADPATWNRCQLVRMPGGRRKGGGRKDANPLREGSPQREAPAAGLTPNAQLPTPNAQVFPSHSLRSPEAVESWALGVTASPASDRWALSPAQRPPIPPAIPLPPNCVRMPGGSRKDANPLREGSPQREAPAAGSTPNAQRSTPNAQGLSSHGLRSPEAVESWALGVGRWEFSPAQRPLDAAAIPLPPSCSPAPIRQQVFFFDPHPCKASISSTNSSEPGAPPASMPALVPMAPG